MVRFSSQLVLFSILRKTLRSNKQQKNDRKIAVLSVDILARALQICSWSMMKSISKNTSILRFSPYSSFLSVTVMSGYEFEKYSKLLIAHRTW